MIAFHFPEEPNTKNTMQRHNINNIPRHSKDHSFVIQVDPEESPKLNLSAMKLLNRFRKIVMRLIFSVPSRSSVGSSSSGGMTSTNTPRKRNSTSCDRFEPPKTSCSSYYSSHSHYNEAISDCIEFFNKSSSNPDGILDFDPESNFMV